MKNTVIKKTLEYIGIIIVVIFIFFYLYFSIEAIFDDEPRDNSSRDELIIPNDPGY